MKLSSTTALAILATATAVSAAPSHVQENDHLPYQASNSHKRDEEQQFSNKLNKREEQELTELVQYINNYKARRDAIDAEIMKRDYAIVTDVLSAINQSQLAPKILDYLVTNQTFQPIIVNVLVSVMKSGLISLQAVLDALVSSNLAVNVINDLIGDCTLYVDLFNIAKSVISDLATKVKDLISGVGRDELGEDPLAPYVVTLERRLDLDSVVDNLLDSLYKSGLATSVVKDILTNSDYIPFAINLIKSMLANNLIDIGSIISALKQSGLIGQLFSDLLNFGTLQTVAVNAFAAFAGTCQGSTSGGISAGTGSGSGSSSGTSTITTGGSSSGSSSSSSGGSAAVGPCKRRVRRRRRRRDLY
ncbi:OPS4 Opaque-phase-specific protein OP4 [Candida maltosa Xu316]